MFKLFQKSRKRQEVTRRVVELRLEDELGCALPTLSRPRFLITNTNGEMDMVGEEFITTSLKEGLSVTVVLKKNLTCVARICEGSVFCVHSCGFASIGLDEVLFVWERIDPTDFSLPLNVLHRIAQVSLQPSAGNSFCSYSFTSAYCNIFPPFSTDFTSLIIPSSPFLIALFLHDAELSWAMACPNRLLFPLKHVFLGYPTPIANILGRDSVYSTETSQTVLKVFTDFHSWSFRMKHLVGCTATLSNDVTLVEIPKSAKNDILSLNRTVIAWATSVNLSADSHLVCDETDGLYSTQVFARGSTRQGELFLVYALDGLYKTSWETDDTKGEHGVMVSTLATGMSNSVFDPHHYKYLVLFFINRLWFYKFYREEFDIEDGEDLRRVSSVDVDELKTLVEVNSLTAV
uniref:DUF3480 domain-containing protein n=1 Tax=Angiostrongylus cantonensis TaxID=6313 RepID=A0A0K0DRT9_ANGCA